MAPLKNSNVKKLNMTQFPDSVTRKSRRVLFHVLNANSSPHHVRKSIFEYIILDDRAIRTIVNIKIPPKTAARSVKREITEQEQHKTQTTQVLALHCRPDRGGGLIDTDPSHTGLP